MSARVAKSMWSSAPRALGGFQISGYKEWKWRQGIWEKYGKEMGEASFWHEIGILLSERGRVQSDVHRRRPGSSKGPPGDVEVGKTK